MRSRRVFVLLMLPLAALSCSDRDQATGRGAAHAAPVRQATGGVIDSALPPGEALRRFRADLREHPTVLTEAARSRDGLVQRFVRALEARDTAALRGMALSRAEFAYLYYPSSRFSTEPYQLPPQTLWSLLQGNSEKGAQRALERRAGHPLRYVDYRCEPEPERQGENRVWNECTVRRVATPGDTVSERLFGSIVERGGRYKFVSYANRL